MIYLSVRHIAMSIHLLVTPFWTKNILFIFLLQNQSKQHVCTRDLLGEVEQLKCEHSKRMSLSC